jgi:integrase
LVAERPVVAQRHLTVEEAVYEGAFGTPKASAGLRRVPLGEGAVGLPAEWRRHARSTEPGALLFSTSSGKLVRPKNVLRRWVFPACDRLGVPRASWLTFRRTYASWAHEKGVPGKVVAQLMGHTKADVTLNVYTQVMEHSLREAVATVGKELIGCSQDGRNRG